MTDLLKRLLEGRFRISSQLYLGIGSAVMLTMVASLVGWFSFNRVGDAQSRVNEGSVPGMAAAFGVAQQSSALVAAAPRVASAASPEAFALVTAEIAKERRTFEAQLAALTQQGGEEERFRRIRAHANTLISNIAAIEQSVAERFVLIERSEALRAELAEVRDVLVGALVPVIDDQLFYAMTGYRNLGEAPAPREKHFSEAEFDRYRHLSELQSDVTIAIQLLASAFNLSDAPLISPLRERFEAAKGRIERSLSELETVSSRDQVAQICAQLFKLGLGEQSGFDLRARELELVSHQRELLAMNNRLAIDLIAEIEGLVSEARVSVQEATHASTQTISTGRRFPPRFEYHQHRRGRADRLFVCGAGVVAPPRATLGSHAPHGRWRFGGKSRYRRARRSGRHGRGPRDFPPSRPRGATLKFGGKVGGRVARQKLRTRKSSGRLAPRTRSDRHARKISGARRTHRGRGPRDQKPAEFCEKLRGGLWGTDRGIGRGARREQRLNQRGSARVDRRNLPRPQPTTWGASANTATAPTALFTACS